MPDSIVHVISKARSHFASLLQDTEFQAHTPEAAAVEKGEVAALILTAYLSADSIHFHAGIQQLVRWRVADNLTPALIFSFQSKQHLLGFPENSILLEPGTSFFRLPCTRDAVLAALREARPLLLAELDEVVHRSCTSWGQLASYIGRLIESSREPGGRAEVLSLGRLYKFALQHFGDWFSGALAHAESYRSRGDISEMIRVLAGVAERGAEMTVYHTFEKLAHGQEEDLVNKGLGPLRAMLLSVQQGVLGEIHLEKLLSSSSWSVFQSSLQKTGNTLTLLRRGPTSLPDALGVQVDLFLDQLHDLLSITGAGHVIPQAPAAMQAIDGMLDATQRIQRQRKEARQRLASELP